MSQSHNITGSEAFSARPKVVIRELPRRRSRVSPFVRAICAIALVGLLAGLIDAAIGAPVVLFVISVAFLIAWLRG